MRLKLPDGGHTSLSETDPRTIKIQQGYGWELKNNKVIVKEKKEHFDMYAFKENIDNTSIEEVREFCKHIIKILSL